MSSHGNGGPERASPAPRMPRAALLCALALSLAACGGRDDGQAGADGAAVAAGEGLPAPEGVRGSVTGMPSGPGPGTVPLAGDLPPDTPVASDDGSEPISAEELREAGIASIEPGYDPALADPAAAPRSAPPASGPGVPPADAAIALVRDYYAALNAGSHAHAHALWADDGRASGQSAAQFSDGFSRPGTMSVAIGGPGAVDTATGTPYIDVPVEVTTTYQDGSRRHFRGIYTLRGEDGGWRIAAADIREILPD